MTQVRGEGRAPMKVPALQKRQVTSRPRAECVFLASFALGCVGQVSRGAGKGFYPLPPNSHGLGNLCNPGWSRGVVLSAAMLPPEEGLLGPVGRRAAAWASQQE